MLLILKPTRRYSIHSSLFLAYLNLYQYFATPLWKWKSFDKRKNPKDPNPPPNKLDKKKGRDNKGRGKGGARGGSASRHGLEDPGDGAGKECLAKDSPANNGLAKDGPGEDGAEKGVLEKYDPGEDGLMSKTMTKIMVVG